MKPKLLFFSRAYQAKLFPLLTSEKYDSVHVTLTYSEKKQIESHGIKVNYCFETFTPEGEVLIPNNYLITSFKSDRFLNKLSFSDRQKTLSKEIAFWREIFEVHQPVAVINEQVAIEIAEVMYIEAKNKGIRYLSWMTNPINGLFYWTSDAISLSLENSFFTKAPSEEAILTAKEYIKNILEKEQKPFYITPFLNLTAGDHLYSATKGVISLLFKKILSKKVVYEDYTDSKINYFKRAANLLYKEYDSLDNFSSCEIILYPLHYEPEASLSYLSEFFSDQPSLIENLIKCLGQNQILVVKEHPAQAGMLLTKKYQYLRKNNSQLVYLPSNLSSFDIIKKSKLIITLTSHLGWEAMIYGKPVVLLGKMFYDKYTGVNLFTSFTQLRIQIRENNFKYPDIASITQYIALIVEKSNKGIPFPSDTLYDKVNIKFLIQAIEKEVCSNYQI